MTWVLGWLVVEGTYLVPPRPEGALKQTLPPVAAERSSSPPDLPQKVHRNPGEHQQQSRPGVSGLYHEEVEHHCRAQHQIEAGQERIADGPVWPQSVWPPDPQHEEPARGQGVKQDGG